MDNTELTQFYDNLKSNLAASASPKTSTMIRVGGPHDYNHPGADLYRRKAMACKHELEDKCAKHIIVDTSDISLEPGAPRVTLPADLNCAALFLRALNSPFSMNDLQKHPSVDLSNK